MDHGTREFQAKTKSSHPQLSIAARNLLLPLGNVTIKNVETPLELLLPSDNVEDRGTREF